MRRAFTLIELIMVIAIIAILAIIIIVNLQLITTRTKIVRAQQDFRALSYGMEAYHIENGRYPPIFHTVAYEQRNLALTTPIAYLSRVYKDPFGDKIDVSYVGSFEYSVYNIVNDSDAYHRLLFNHHRGYGLNQRMGLYSRWYAQSQGPDLIPNERYRNPTKYWLLYDPTNGTISDGDIFYTGPSGWLLGG